MITGECILLDGDNAAKASARGYPDCSTGKKKKTLVIDNELCESNPSSCPLTSIQAQWHIYLWRHTIHILDANNDKKKMKD